LPDRLDIQSQARRVAREFNSGDVVALGPGMPCSVPAVMPVDVPVYFLADSGALGYAADVSPESSSAAGLAVDSGGQGAFIKPGGTFLSTVDLAAMLRVGQVATAVIQPAWIAPAGDLIHWTPHRTTAAAPELPAVGASADLANGARRVIAMMSHTSAEGSPNIVEHPVSPTGGAGRVDLIVTDVAVLRVEGGGLTLAELAPGWRVDDVAAITGAPLSSAADLKEIDLGLPQLAPVSKVFASGLDALADMPDGVVVNIDGFAGPGGMPHYLMVALRDRGAKELTIISNTAGLARVINFGTPPGLRAIDHSILVDNNQVKKAIASYPVSPSASTPTSFELAYQRGEVELEVVPQGTLAERIRAGGAGVAAFYTPTAAGTLLAEGKETKVIDGVEYVLELALRADYCIIRGHKADTLGNVVYKGTSRNFNPIMATSAGITVVEVDEIVAPGELDPEAIVTPGVYIDRIVLRPADFSPYD